MREIRKILFPTDFSPCADQAFNHALFLAEQFGAELHLLHAVVLHSDLHDSEGQFPEVEEVYRRLEKVGQSRAAALLEPHRGEALKILEIQRRGLAAAEVILDYIEAEGIDLTVLGTHGRRGVGRFFLGSVAEEVVRLAPCPVLTLRQQDDPRPVKEVGKILVPVDFSEHSLAALDAAAALAPIYGAKLEVLHIVQPPAYPELYYPGQPAAATAAAMDIPLLRQRAHDSLTQWVIERELEAVAEVKVLEGYAATRVPHYAQEVGADLIVLSTQGLTGLKHLLLGSVAEKVVRLAHCPVLTLKG